jgi:hypothetical protein
MMDPEVLDAMTPVVEALERLGIPHYVGDRWPARPTAPPDRRETST